MNPIDIMRDAYLNNYQGSVTDLIDQQMEVAQTAEQQQKGLTEGAPRALKIPGAESITTQGMDYPIDIQAIDQSTGLVDSTHTNVQPGEIVETGAGKDVIETPSMRTGGSLRDKVGGYMKKNRNWQ